MSATLEAPLKTNIGINPNELDWNAVEQRLEVGFEKFWTEWGSQNLHEITGRNVADPDLAKHEALEREKGFFNKVYDAAMTMANNHNGPVTLLFDLDQTMIENDPNKKGTEAKVVRPAFPILMDVLRQEIGEDRLEVGTLTQIPSGYLTPNGETPSYLESAGKSAKPKFFKSSGDIERSDKDYRKLWLGDDVEAKIAAVGDIVDPEIIEATKKSPELAHQWFSAKLMILNRVVQENPDRSFVYVDDLVTAAVINPDHPQVVGVYVGPETQTEMWRTPHSQNELGLR